MKVDPVRCPDWMSDERRVQVGSKVLRPELLGGWGCGFWRWTGCGPCGPGGRIRGGFR